MSTQNRFKKFRLLGVDIDAVGMAEALDYITEIGGNPSTKSCYVVKPYVEFLDQAKGSKELQLLLNNSKLCLPDGVALQWAASFLYNKTPTKLRFWGLAASIILLPTLIAKPLPEKFSGTNFTWPLLRACRDQELKVFLIGTPSYNDIEHTVDEIHKKLVGIKIVGSLPGEINGLKGQNLIQYIRKHPLPKSFIRPLKEAAPDIILVGMGFPLQEYVMARLQHELPHGVMIGEGGTFDYESFGGGRKKAPAWMQKTGLEWLWRLILEPTRLNRQKSIPRFMKTIYQVAFPANKKPLPKQH